MTIPHNEFCEEIDKKITDIQISLGGGKAADWADYKRMVGLIAGLRQSKDVLKDTLKKHIEDDDDIE